MSPRLSLVVLLSTEASANQRFVRWLCTQTTGRSTEVVLVESAQGATRGNEAEQLHEGGYAVQVVSAVGCEPAVARRRGVAQATGAWVAFPDVAHEFDTSYLRRLHDALEAYSATAHAFVVHGAADSQEADVVERAALGDGEHLTVPPELRGIVTRRREVPDHGVVVGADHDELLIADLLSDSTSESEVRIVHGVTSTRVGRIASEQVPQAQRIDAQWYFDAVEGIASRITTGGAPHWRNDLLVRMLRRLVGYERTTTNRSVAFVGAEGERFRHVLGNVLRQFTIEALAPPSMRQRYDEVRDLMLALRGEVSAVPPVHLLDVDVRAGLMQVRFPHIASEAPLTAAREGREIAARYSKRRHLVAFGGTVAEQTIAWFPAGSQTEFRVADSQPTFRFPDGNLVPDGAETDLAHLWHEHRSGHSRAAVAHPRGGLAARLKHARTTWLSRAALVRWVARSGMVQRLRPNIWVLMDRADQARDNAEHLCRWLVRNRPEVNTYFVVRRDSPDFARLRGEGFRMVAYGSLRHQFLLHAASQYVSSHAGIDVSRPFADRFLREEPTWQFTFLQHGVTHNDLSTWLNNQSIRVFVSSTHAEHDELAHDSRYVFTEREVRLTGMPRFDALRRIADAAPVTERRTIVIAPTWRNSLLLPPKHAGALRQPRAGFSESEFIQSIVGLLNHPRLEELVRSGFEVQFVPHPNIAAFFPYDAIPDYVSTSSYTDRDVQELIGTAAVFVTDYSSVAFDAAFADAAVVYLQVDGARVFGVDHTLSRGYFDHERDGFGPVARSTDEAMAAVVAAAKNGRPAEYEERARRTFAFHDMGACERVFLEITSIS